MHANDLLLKTLQSDYPILVFTEANEFRWQPSTRTIHYIQTDDAFAAHLLHEVAHALLEHASYERDIDLIAMERDAWKFAREMLAPKYNTEITSTIIETNMNTYRDWLHERSTCPRCTATGLQIKRRAYRCLACTNQWRVNDARICALRRYTIIN